MMNDYALRELRPNIKDKLKDYILKRNKKKQTRIKTKTCKKFSMIFRSSCKSKMKKEKIADSK